MTTEFAQPTSISVKFFHIFSVLGDHGIEFVLGDFKNVLGSFYVIQGQIVRIFATKNFEYGRRPTKPDLSYCEVYSQMWKCVDNNPYKNYFDTVIVLGI